MDVEPERCTNCGGPLHELSVDGPVEQESVTAALLHASPGDMVRFQTVCEDCDRVIERYVQVDPMYCDRAYWEEFGSSNR